MKYEGNSQDLLELFKLIAYISFTNKNKILIKLSKSLYFRTLLVSHFTNHLTGILEEYIGLMSIFINADNNEIDIKYIIPSIDNFILPILFNGNHEYNHENIKNLDKLVTYIGNIFYLNNSYTQIHQSKNDAKKCSSINFCISLCKVLLYIYEKLDKSLSVKYNIIKNNLRNNIINTIVHSLTVSYIPLKRIKKTLRDELYHIHNDISMLFFGMRNENNIQSEKNILTKKIKSIESIYKDISLANQIDTFIKMIVTEYNNNNNNNIFSDKNNNKFSDDFIMLMIDIIIDKIDNSIDFNLTSDQVSFFFKIISAEYNTNKNIRFSICMVVFQICEIKGYAKLYDSYSYDNTLDKLYNFSLSSIFKFVSDVNYLEMNQPPFNYIFHQNLLSFINYHSEKFKSITNLNPDDKLSLSLCNTALYKIISCANKFIFDIMKICKEVSDEFKEKKIIGYQLTIVKQQLSPIILEYIRNCMASIQTISNFMKSNIIKLSDFSDELILSLSNFISSTIDYLADGKGIIYVILHMNMETKDLLSELYVLLNIACDNTEFINNIVKKIHLITEMGNKIKINATLQTEILNKLKKVSVNSNNNNDKNDKNYNNDNNDNNDDDNNDDNNDDDNDDNDDDDDDDDDLPNEFCDPFLYTEIKNPVLVPNCNQFFDKISIMSHLRITPSNPITSEELSIDEFNDYNNTDKVKELINDFNKRKSKYKILNNK